jgi:hypothetical protein
MYNKSIANSGIALSLYQFTLSMRNIQNPLTLRKFLCKTLQGLA